MRSGAWIHRQSRSTILGAALCTVVVAGPAVIGLEALVRARLTEGMLPVPTRYYARPIVLDRGRRVNRDGLQRHLRRMGYRRAARSRVGIGEYHFGSRTWTVGRRAFRHYGRVAVGGVVSVRLGWNDRITSLRDATGKRLDRVVLEPELLRSVPGESHEDRIPVTLSEIPQLLVDAVLSTEDQRFFEHGAIHLKRIAGAALANMRAGRVVQGGSTITQQLVKNLFLSAKRTPLRKLRELAMATVLEARHTKEEILEAYLNEIYLGQDGARAIHGVGRAAQFYFGKDVTELDTAEGALLAGMIRGPSLYSPIRHLDAARARRDLVLRLMSDRGVITEDVYRDARATPLKIRNRPEPVRSGRYFVDFVANRLARSGGKKTVRGSAVFTTLDMDLQLAAENAVRDGLHALEAEHANLVRESRPLQAAVVAIDPRTGEVLAMVGGREYGESQFNRAVLARRQPGSAFKPIVALAALSQDRGFTLATMLRDDPLSVQTPAGSWQPANYDGRFRGSVSLRDALERSLNVPFARLGMEVGPEHIVEAARSLGLESPINPVPSLALGSSEVTPLEMTRAFGVLAAGGFRARLATALGVLDPEGNMLNRLEVDGERVYRPAETYLVTSALRGAVERGTGRALRRLGYHGPVAAKSGTTNDYRDAWFVGYTPTLAVGVWVGFDDGVGIGLPGSRAALPIFAEFLVAARLDEDGDFPYPAGVEVVEVNRETGLRAGPGCRGEPEVFLRGTAPSGSCSRWAYPRWHRTVRSRPAPSRFGESRRRSRPGRRDRGR